MVFYKSIAANYQHIFPLNNEQVRFVDHCIDKSNRSSLLEVGCAIGELTKALSGYFDHTVGIDLDEEMIKIAQAQNHTGIDFQFVDMRDVDTAFSPNSFNCIVCFGNTLVHLPSEKEILDFLKSSKNLLKESGKLFLQIINYDRILDQDIHSLPTIENDFIRFERNYNNLSASSINFDTKLLLKETGQTITNSIPLYPIRQSKLTSLLLEAGFSEVNFYGNFKKEPLLKKSIPLIVEAK